MKRLLIPNDLRAGRRQTYTLLLTGLLLCGALPLIAQGTLGNPDSENLGGRGPGDIAVVPRGNRTYVEMLHFDAKQIVTYRLEADNALTEVGRTPTCDEPRQLAVTTDNRWLFVACSSQNSVWLYAVGDPLAASSTGRKLSNVMAAPLSKLFEFAVRGEVYDVEIETDCIGDDERRANILLVTNRSNGKVASFEVPPQVFDPDNPSPQQLIFLNEQAAGLDPHVLKRLCRIGGFRITPGGSSGAIFKSGESRQTEQLALVAVGNSTSNDLSTYYTDREGRLHPIAGSIPQGGSPRALAFDPSGRRLYVAVRGTPPAEDQIRTYKVGAGGELTFVGTTPGGRFLTDIEATSDRVFVVTINNQNRDEIRTYRRRGTDLILDSALTTPSQPNFKQITVGPSQGNLTNVFVTEYQGGFMRSLTYTRDNQVACVGDAETLCLNGMELQVDFVASDNRGYGQAAALTSDTGYFYFFNRDNVELVPKVLDARTVNGSFWVFYGALSNVAYTLRVTDTRTGRVKVYDNPAGTLASQADTNAFPAASGGPRKTAASAASAEELYAIFTGGQSARAPVSFAACAPGSARLCVTQNRFQVQVDWRVPSQGRSGSGSAVPVTGDTGYFWFFDSANVELIIKVLDARVINGKFWVFYGALSNVEYTITVTDTETGAVKVYANPSGTLASVADTSAF